MSNTKKQPQEAQVGDRVWVKDSVSGEMYGGTVKSIESESDCVTIFADGAPFTRLHSHFGALWGFLAADEAVIGGVLVRHDDWDEDLWNIGVRLFSVEDILDGGLAFMDGCARFNFKPSEINAIQDHVRKHSAPAPVPKKATPKETSTGVEWRVWDKAEAEKPKRTAADAKVGDEVWVIDSTNYVKFDGVIRAIEPHGHEWKLTIAVGISYYIRFRFEFGVDWGFPEDRPDTAKELPADQPAPDKEKPLPPQMGNVALLIKAKGSDWVRANYPDLWDAYKEAGLEKVRSAAEKLAKPGPLAGKIPNLH